MEPQHWMEEKEECTRTSSNHWSLINCKSFHNYVVTTVVTKVPVCMLSLCSQDEGSENLSENFPLILDQGNLKD